MLQDANRLRKDTEFEKLYKRGFRKYNSYFGIYYRPGKKKFGIVVSKKHGNAVHRNKLKRRIRACLEECIPNLAWADIVIVPKPGAGELTYKELRKNLRHVLKIAKVLS